MAEYEPPPAGTGKCARCEQLYGTWFDLVIPDAAWAAISPRGDEGGLLCPNCMHALLVEAGYDIGGAPGIIASGPMCSPSDGTDYYFAVAKAALQQNEKLRAEIESWDEWKRIGQSIALTALEDFEAGRMRELKRSLQALAGVTPPPKRRREASLAKTSGMGGAE